jgi:autotransporter translocation and assembly factor TamB
MKTSRSFLAAFAACFLFAAAAFAGDPSGTWRWTVNTPNGDIETTLNLTLKDGQLSGTYSNSFGSVAISSATFKDDAIAFKVEREFDGNKFVLSYAGKLAGDAITGKIEVPGFGGGEGNKIDWNAKRAASTAEKP